MVQFIISNQILASLQRMIKVDQFELIFTIKQDIPEG